jgi:hypothetical protein
MEADPFTQVYDMLVTRLKEAKAWVSVIDWNSTKNPQADIASTSDLPEVQLRPIGLTASFGMYSCSSPIVRDYALTIATGSNILEKLFKAEWALMGVLHRLKYGQLDALSYKGQKFVIDLSFVSGQSGIALPTTRNKQPGWTVLSTIRVHMSFGEFDQ